MKNWFNNQTSKTVDRLPFRIRRRWTARTVLGLQQAAAVGEAATVMAMDDPQKRKAIAFWAKAVNEAYENLSKDDQDALTDTAVKWDANGPDAKYKPR